MSRPPTLPSDVARLRLFAGGKAAPGPAGEGESLGKRLPRLVRKKHETWCLIKRDMDDTDDY